MKCCLTSKNKEGRMLSKAFFVISMLGVIWLAAGLVIIGCSSMRYRTLTVNLPKLILGVAVVLLTLLTAIAASYNGW